MPIIQRAAYWKIETTDVRGRLVPSREGVGPSPWFRSQKNGLYLLEHAIKMGFVCDDEGDFLEDSLKGSIIPVRSYYLEDFPKWHPEGLTLWDILENLEDLTEIEPEKILVH